MKKLTALVLIVAAGFASAEGTALLDYDFRRLASEESINLADEFKGDVVLLVNTASKCGNTPQYDGLEKLYQEYGERGLTVVGVPSNDFMGQEPGTEAEIQEFCRLTYKVKFPMVEKTEVKGKKAHPMYAGLAEASGTYPTWNFHKFLIGRDGELIAEFSPRTQPYDAKLVAAIETALDAS